MQSHVYFHVLRKEIKNRKVSTTVKLMQKLLYLINKSLFDRQNERRNSNHKEQQSTEKN